MTTWQPCRGTLFMDQNGEQKNTKAVFLSWARLRRIWPTSRTPPVHVASPVVLGHLVESRTTRNYALQTQGPELWDFQEEQASPRQDYPSDNGPSSGPRPGHSARGPAGHGGWNDVRGAGGVHAVFCTVRVSGHSGCGCQGTAVVCPRTCGSDGGTARWPPWLLGGRGPGVSNEGSTKACQWEL